MSEILLISHRWISENSLSCFRLDSFCQSQSFEPFYMIGVNLSTVSPMQGMRISQNSLPSNKHRAFLSRSSLCYSFSLSNSKAGKSKLEKVLTPSFGEEPNQEHLVVGVQSQHKSSIVLLLLQHALDHLPKLLLFFGFVAEIS